MTDNWSTRFYFNPIQACESGSAAACQVPLIN